MGEDLRCGDFMLFPLPSFKLGAMVALLWADSLPVGWSPPLPQNSSGDVSFYQWVCPDDPQISISLNSSDGRIFKLEEHNHGVVQPIKDIESPLDADYLGIGSMNQRAYKWIGSRLFLTQNEYGVGIVDVANARFVVNNTSVSFLQLPHSDRFIILPMRGVPRHGEFEYSAYIDTIGLIDPDHLNLQSKSMDAWDHVAKRLKLPGVMASPFFNLKVESHIGAFVLSNSSLHFLVIDGVSLQIIKDVVFHVPIPSSTIQALQGGGVDSTLATSFHPNVTAED